jgi:hypothetical protein
MNTFIKKFKQELLLSRILWRENLQLLKLSAWSIKQFYLEYGTTFRITLIVYCSKVVRDIELKPL